MYEETLTISRDGVFVYKSSDENSNQISRSDRRPEENSNNMPYQTVRLQPTNVRFWIEPEIEKDLTVDFTCKFAHSRQLRCAVNPSGPCKGCGDYEAKTGKELAKPIVVGVDSSNDAGYSAFVCTRINENGEHQIKNIRFTHISDNERIPLIGEVLDENGMQYSVGYTCELNTEE
jgi:hypothetical protein